MLWKTYLYVQFIPLSSIPILKGGKQNKHCVMFLIVILLIEIIITNIMVYNID